MFGLKDLLEGMDEVEFMEECICDSVCPAICVECGYITEMEPDQDRGWCEVCSKNTVKSGLVLMGVI